MAFPVADVSEIPESVEIYAETAADIELTLRTRAQVFPAARVAAAFSGQGLQPAHMESTDLRTRMYTVTIYEPPEDLTYAVQEMLKDTDVEIADMKAYFRKLAKWEHVLGTMSLSEEDRRLLRIGWAEMLSRTQK